MAKWYYNNLMCHPPCSMEKKTGVAVVGGALIDDSVKE